MELFWSEYLQIHVRISRVFQWNGNWKQIRENRDKKKCFFVYSTHIGKSHRVSNFNAIDNANMEMENRKRKRRWGMIQGRRFAAKPSKFICWKPFFRYPWATQKFYIFDWKTHLAAKATSVCTWFRSLHAVSISTPAQRLLLKLCRKPIVIRPVSRFGLYSVNEIVELLPKYSKSPMERQKPEVYGNALVCSLVSILICGIGW